MGWRIPEFWVEVDNYTVNPLLRANTLFAVQRWKTFLLGHKKYGPKASWEPEKELRGLPEDVSDTVEREAEEQDYSYATYYTLKELEEIDLDEEMGFPTLGQLKEKRDGHKYGVDFKMIADGEEYYFNNHYFPVEKRVEAIEKGSTDIEMFHREGRYALESEELIKNSEKMSKGTETPKPEKVSVRLEAEVAKKRDYAADLEELIELLNELRTSEELSGNRNIQKEEGEKLSKEDFRLVIFV